MTKIFLSLLLFAIGFTTHAQSIRGKLQWRQGQKLAIQVEFKATVTQQAMGKAIDFSTDGSALHHYTVSAITSNNASLDHEIENMNFVFDGMGQKHIYNSANPADTTSQFNDYIKKTVRKKYQVVIDATGKVIQTIPEITEPVKADGKMALVSGMIKDITEIAYPPRKGDASFFKILPAKEITPGETWIDSVKTENSSLKTIYKLVQVTDSTIIVEFNGTGVSTSKTIMMGRDAVTTMNNTETGKIILDRATGIIKEKTTNTESNGTMEAMGGSMPVNSKSSLSVHIKSE